MTDNSVRYFFDSEHRFCIENYNWAKPNSGFFPGIAGKFGIPLWTHYVNRAQTISSLGSRDKDGAILEFLSFNRACQLVGTQGFRTFLKLDGDEIYEPYRRQKDNLIRQKMTVTSSEIVLEEQNDHLALKFLIEYFPLVSMPISGLVRKVTITNEGDTDRRLELVDGIPRILPYGVLFEHVKVIPRHIEAMMGVFDHNGIPTFRLKQSPADVSQVGELEATNYYFSATPDGHVLKDCYLTDPEILFNVPNNFDHPWSLLEGSALDLLSSPGLSQNRTPCAFTVLDQLLESDDSFSIYSIIGHSPEGGRLSSLLENLQTPDFFLRRRGENKEIVGEIKSNAWTSSNVPLLDSYCQETFLENAMRGGIPAFLSESANTPLYTYSRQNGDLERDYHWYVLEPTYFSQGNGHYRSICQNRRMDSWFFPKIFDHNLYTFMNLIQTDGYNPLVLNVQKSVTNDTAAILEYLKSKLDNGSAVEELAAFSASPFTPGEFLLKLESYLSLNETKAEKLLEGLLEYCDALEIGDTHAGFWIDHWTYNIDLLENILNIYPDKLGEILWDRKDYTFYDNPDIVLPRAKKYIRQEGKVRQYNAIKRDDEKLRLIASRKTFPNKVRTDHGFGQVYKTTLLIKLLCILANRIAALDPRGIGVEMEADKPGWNDSLNGLPGLFGSSLCQTLELIRTFRIMRTSLDQLLRKNDIVHVYEELANLILGLTNIFKSHPQTGDALVRWEKCHDLLEGYRAETRLGISGDEQILEVATIHDFVKTCLGFLETIFSDNNRKQLFDNNGVPYTYYTHEVTAFEEIREPSATTGKPEGSNAVKALDFKATPSALFLEGPAHYLKVFPEDASTIYAAVKESALFDPHLQMYKVCESLEDQPMEIGRIQAYTSGWLENESVYTHMEFKWLLEILQSGLYEEFFNEMRLLLPPFMDPATYGRCTLENCSFIVSSAFPDSKIHGQAFQPRLSGVTAEMLEIWTIMVVGAQPFRIDTDGNLSLHLEPVLPDWLFTDDEKTIPFREPKLGWHEITLPKNTFAFRFLGQTLMVYHNAGRKSTFGADPVRVRRCQITHRNGREIQTDGPVFGRSIAESLRQGEIYKLEAWLS